MICKLLSHVLLSFGVDSWSFCCTTSYCWHRTASNDWLSWSVTSHHYTPKPLGSPALHPTNFQTLTDCGSKIYCTLSLGRNLSQRSATALDLALSNVSTHEPDEPRSPLRRTNRSTDSTTCRTIGGTGASDDNVDWTSRLACFRLYGHCLANIDSTNLVETVDDDVSKDDFRP